MTICDPVTLEIIRGAIAAGQAEMEALLERTAIARSSARRRISTPRCSTPMASWRWAPTCRSSATSPAGVQPFPPDTMQPGDLYWYNDCYASRGAVSHSNDQVFLAPVFHAGRRAAFVMGWAHFSDIGGLRPGSISPGCDRYFQEGIIIPATKLIDGGATNHAALEIFHRNSRFPRVPRRHGALMAAVALGVRRMEELPRVSDADTAAAALQPVAGPHRSVVRTRLAETFPRGTHRFTDAIDCDGHGNGPFRIRLALTRTTTIASSWTPGDRRPGDRSGELPDEPRCAGHGAGLVFIGGDPHRWQCRRAAGHRCRAVCGRVRCCPRASPRRLGLRGLTMMRVLAALNG